MAEMEHYTAVDCLVLALISDHLSNESNASEDVPYVLSTIHSHNLLANPLHHSAWRKWCATLADLMSSRVPTARWAGASLLSVSLRSVLLDVQTVTYLSVYVVNVRSWLIQWTRLFPSEYMQQETRKLQE